MAAIGAFSSVLIANRGEIARRVQRSCRALGLESVAVYSDADRDAPFVSEADRAVRIGPAAAARSYLDVEAILAAARTTGAQAIHPGYGFLSEDARFAARVVEAGLTFVGPSAEAIARMGSKIEAKAAAAAAGVPVLPGHSGSDQSDERLLTEARALVPPFMVKASAGGGGRGMRLVTDQAEAAEAIRSARAEAVAAFGDGSVFLERSRRGPATSRCKSWAICTETSSIAGSATALFSATIRSWSRRHPRRTYRTRSARRCWRRR